jgi:hypothetical protein
MLFSNACVVYSEVTFNAFMPAMLPDALHKARPHAASDALVIKDVADASKAQ